MAPSQINVSALWVSTPFKPSLRSLVEHRSVAGVRFPHFVSSSVIAAQSGKRRVSCCGSPVDFLGDLRLDGRGAVEVSALDVEPDARALERTDQAVERPY